MPPNKDLLAMWAHFQNPVFMKEIGNELFPLMKWSVDYVILEELETLFRHEINKMVSSHDFQIREIKIIEDKVNGIFNSLKLNHRNSYPSINKSEEDIYLILCKYPNFPKKIKEEIYWKYKAPTPTGTDPFTLS